MSKEIVDERKSAAGFWESRKPMLAGTALGLGLGIAGGYAATAYLAGSERTGHENSAKDAQTCLDLVQSQGAVVESASVGNEALRACGINLDFEGADGKVLNASVQLPSSKDLLQTIRHEVIEAQETDQLDATTLALGAEIAAVGVMFGSLGAQNMRRHYTSVNLRRQLAQV